MNTEEPKWLCRVTEKKGYNKRKDLSENQVICELVWGIWQQRTTNGGLHISEIIGQSYHELRGPTAEKSIEAMAEQMNAKGEKPPDRNDPKTRLDGWKQRFNDDSGMALFTPAELKASISYKEGK